mmetsp:Transcript_15100/g.21178  ORF Transcript_15100/g.21178 Transcript_15100/m.21178 type:complete len:759 (-) Transcript_15100:73-2349(-)
MANHSFFSSLVYSDKSISSFEDLGVSKFIRITRKAIHEEEKGILVENEGVLRADSHNVKVLWELQSGEEDTRVLSIAFGGSANFLNFFDKLDSRAFVNMRGNLSFDYCGGENEALFRNLNQARVKEGMYDCYSLIRDELVGLIRCKEPDRVELSGHSLGGGLATIAAVDLLLLMGAKSGKRPACLVKCAVRLVTFGAPRVGNFAFYELCMALGLDVTAVHFQTWWDLSAWGMRVPVLNFLMEDKYANLAGKRELLDEVCTTPCQVITDAFLFRKNPFMLLYESHSMKKYQACIEDKYFRCSQQVAFEKRWRCTGGLLLMLAFIFTIFKCGTSRTCSVMQMEFKDRISISALSRIDIAARNGETALVKPPVATSVNGITPECRNGSVEFIWSYLTDLSYVMKANVFEEFVEKRSLDCERLAHCYRPVQCEGIVLWAYFNNKDSDGALEYFKRIDDTTLSPDTYAKLYASLSFDGRVDVMNSIQERSKGKEVSVPSMVEFIRAAFKSRRYSLSLAYYNKMKARNQIAFSPLDRTKGKDYMRNLMEWSDTMAAEACLEVLSQPQLRNHHPADVERACLSTQKNQSQNLISGADPEQIATFASVFERYFSCRDKISRMPRYTCNKMMQKLSMSAHEIPTSAELLKKLLGIMESLQGDIEFQRPGWWHWRLHYKKDYKIYRASPDHWTRGEAIRAALLTKDHEFAIQQQLAVKRLRDQQPTVVNENRWYFEGPLESLRQQTCKMLLEERSLSGQQSIETLCDA